MKKWLMPVACHMFTYTLKDSARIWWNSQKAGSILNYEDLKAKFRSHFSQQKKFTKTHLAILGLHEDQRISSFVHSLRTRSLVVGIKSLLDAVKITGAQVYVNTALMKLVLLMNFKENILNMDQDSAHMVAASKVPMLKPGEYEIWRMRIEQYIQMIDYVLWEVIENGATLPKTTIVEGVMTEMPITTAEEKA
ncbi:uncharacterized mitochondrial protein-like protein [Tanacetum coccineum]